MNRLHAMLEWCITAGKHLLPKSLFARALLILVLPTLLMQILAITIFYDRHWNNIQRHLSTSLAGEVALVLDRIIRTPPEEREDALRTYEQMMNMDVTLLPRADMPLKTANEKRFNFYMSELGKRIDLPYTVFEMRNEQIIRTKIALRDTLVNIDVDIKRLESSTTYIFVLWVVGSSILFTMIAVAFLRNQIRPIRRLASAAERFGLGQDVSDYRPHGALEVRKAGKAFVTMRARIERQIKTRTAMLSGISHDLRTPLTRLKLELEMLDDVKQRTEMQRDILDMEHMITEYLDFVRGSDDAQPYESVDMAELLRTIAQKYLKNNAALTYSVPESVMVLVHPLHIGRAVQNVIDNALRYAKHCHMSLEKNDAWMMICIEDDGPGIPQEMFTEVFRPFVRLDEGRNADAAGSGLGLAITRDIIQSHGGKVHLQNRLNGLGNISGLTVVLSLPLSR
jgi:two-component system, OmpR family, osmolarity sensor histidine kinase EnvZ